MSTNPILILGAGINGCALARELVLNGIGVHLVDTADIASGTTACSSRLIHGGLRYLEHGEFDLVRESLAERTRLLKLAPQFVHPLELFIPVENRLGGVFNTSLRFFRLPEVIRPRPRGEWLVRIGLWFYDKYARDPSLPRHRVHRLKESDAIRVDPSRFIKLCSYFDAQIHSPELFSVALLEDAARLASENNVTFGVWNYHAAQLEGHRAKIVPVARHASDVASHDNARDQANSPHPSPVFSFEPAAVINTTGAWVDGTLQKLGISSRRLIGGTKGSHFFTSNPDLGRRLAGRGIYAEAPDGRPVFVLPFGPVTMIGTTDLKFEHPPETAVATEQELRYLLETVNKILGDQHLTREDVAFYYSGIRPLPYSDASTTGAITRRHAIHEHPETEVPCYSIIGGKLTTSRSLAEEATATILKRLEIDVTADSRDRVIPGGEEFPRDEAASHRLWNEVGKRHAMSTDQVEALWPLLGTRVDAVCAAMASDAAARHAADAISDVRPPPPPDTTIQGTHLPVAYARWVIRHQWARTLDDLVERRLMLLYLVPLSRKALEQLAELLVEAGYLDQQSSREAVAATVKRLDEHFGKRVQNAGPSE